MRYTLKSDIYSSHSQIAIWLRRYQAQALPIRPCVVYDIGCAQGFLGELLEPVDFHLFGVDSDPEAVALARQRYVEVFCADIETPLAFKFAESPSVMVLADVLEHTREPSRCLQDLCRTYLPSGAWVIISVPNFAHLYSRLSLLAGRFSYSERGIFDRTHLRFFTLAGALAMVRACNITVHEIAVTPVPLPLIHDSFAEGHALWPLNRLNAALASAFKTLLGYQIIIYGTYQP